MNVQHNFYKKRELCYYHLTHIHKAQLKEEHKQYQNTGCHFETNQLETNNL